MAARCGTFFVDFYCTCFSMGDLGVQVFVRSSVHSSSVRPSVNIYPWCLVSATPLTVCTDQFETLHVFSSRYEDVHYFLLEGVGAGAPSTSPKFNLYFLSGLLSYCYVCWVLSDIVGEDGTGCFGFVDLHLRKHAYSNILKISPPKTESF